MIDEDKVIAIEVAEIEQVKIRSVLTCNTNTGVCAACYGRDLARGTRQHRRGRRRYRRPVDRRAGTQLTMRTFHIGGAVQRGAEQSKVEAASDGTVILRNCFTVRNSAGVPVVMNRNAELLLVDAQGANAPPLPYGSKLLHEDKAQVRRGDKLAEWDPYTLPIITEKEGYAHYVDLVDGVSMIEQMDEATGIASKVVTDWKQQPRGADLKPRITLRDEAGEVILLENGVEARYFLSADAILSVENGQKVHGGDLLARIPRESAKTGTSRVVCRASPNSSRRASRRIMRSSRRSPAASNSARTTSRSARSSWFPATTAAKSLAST